MTIDPTAAPTGTGAYADINGVHFYYGADMAPPSHYVEVFALLDGGQRDGGWMGEGRPKGGHALAILPGLTHYDIGVSALLAQTASAFLDAPEA